MPERRYSTTSGISLDEVIHRLSEHWAVDGIIVVGSASRDKLNPASDYDLVVVLSEMPVPLHVGVTNIDGRFADLVFYKTEQVNAFLATTEPLDFWSWTGRMVGWLQDGRIVLDRDGRLQQGQKKAKEGEWIRPSGTEHGFKAWNSVNYNLQVVGRYLSSDDPLYLATADIRMMIYGPSDLFFNYFEIRRLRWDGEKTAIQYLQKHDPEYLALFNQFLAENDRQAKFRFYKQLAEMTVAPVGRLWQENDTVMIIDADEVTPEMENRALDFWQELVQG